jgi:hypothetical protein
MLHVSNGYFGGKKKKATPTYFFNQLYLTKNLIYKTIILENLLLLYIYNP